MPVLFGDEQDITRLKHTLLIGSIEEVWELDHIWIFNIHLGKADHATSSSSSAHYSFVVRVSSYAACSIEVVFRY